MNSETPARDIFTLAVLLLTIATPMPAVIAADQPTESLGIDVRILDTDGDPVDQSSSVTIWKQVSEIVDERTPATTDPRNGTICQRVAGSSAGQHSPTRNGKDRFLAEKLDPGNYRLNVSARSRAYGYPDYDLDQPLAEKRVYLDGDLLPPSSSVAAVATTDAAGRFQFDRVTPGFQWWFEPPDPELARPPPGTNVLSAPRRECPPDGGRDPANRLDFLSITARVLV